jgi:single-stranded DNA-binding protein
VGRQANYFTVEVYGAQARACAQYLRNGSRAFVDAELDWREWTDQQDNKREAVTFKGGGDAARDPADCDPRGPRARKRSRRDRR